MVDLVGKDAQGERLVDSLVEAEVEQLEQTFSAAALWFVKTSRARKNSLSRGV